jgi:hypothetical protein
LTRFGLANAHSSAANRKRDAAHPENCADWNIFGVRMMLTLWNLLKSFVCHDCEMRLEITGDLAGDLKFFEVGWWDETSTLQGAKGPRNLLSWLWEWFK